MNNNFEKEVYYFIMLVFNNIQVAKTKKNKQKAIFSNLKFILDRKEIKIWNKEKKYSYTLYTNQIQNYNFKNHITKYLALIYIDKLTKYINKKITFEELADIIKTPKKVKKIIDQKKNISEQLKLLRKNRNITEVQEYIDKLYNYEYTSEYVKYLIDRYYYNKKGLQRPRKNCLERMFKLLLHQQKKKGIMSMEIKKFRISKEKRLKK